MTYQSEYICETPQNHHETNELLEAVSSGYKLVDTRERRVSELGMRLAHRSEIEDDDANKRCVVELH